MKREVFPIPRVHLPGQRGLDHLPRNQINSQGLPNGDSAVYRQSHTTESLLAFKEVCFSSFSIDPYSPLVSLAGTQLSHLPQWQEHLKKLSILQQVILTHWQLFATFHVMPV